MNKILGTLTPSTKLISLIIILLFNASLSQAAPRQQYIIPEYIEVDMFAYDFNTGDIIEACKKDSEQLGCGDVGNPYPYDSSALTVSLENEYLPTVIAQEIGYGYDIEAYKAAVIAARSYALHLVEFSDLNNTTNHQAFLPVTVTPDPIHRQAVNETHGTILVCNNDTDCASDRRGFPAFAEHSHGHDGQFTTSWTYIPTPHGYLTSVYDPVHTQAGGGHGRGISQEGTKRWAAGVDENGNPIPPYDYRRILAHYYTGIDFVGLTPDPPNDYRFNVLYFEGLDDRADNPLILRADGEYDFPFIVQNTGDNDWPLLCQTSPPYTYNAAMSFHWYSYPAKQYLAPQTPYFEGTRTRLCPNVANGSIVEPGEEYPSQRNGANLATSKMYVQVSPGDYWLRLDVEFP